MVIYLYAYHSKESSYRILDETSSERMTSQESIFFDIQSAMGYSSSAFARFFYCWYTTRYMGGI